MMLNTKNLNGVGETALLPFIEKYVDVPTTTYKIVPDYMIDNSNNEAIAHAISTMYLSPRERINIRNFAYASPKQVYFDIIFRPKNEASFYLTVDKQYTTLIESKMKTVWNKAEISSTNRENIDNFNINNTAVCELVLKDYNFKSLSISKGHLYPLTNMFSVLRGIKEGEQIRVNIAIEPIKRSNWVNIAKDEFEAYKSGKVIDNEMGTKEKLFKLGFQSAEAALGLFIEYKLLLLESVMGIVTPDPKEDKRQKFDLKIDSIEAVKESLKYNGLTPSTVQKLISEAFKVKISILSESNDSNRAKLNMLAVASAYKDLKEDNELVIKPLTESEQNLLFRQVINMDVVPSRKCILSDKEVAKLIQLPQRDLQNEYQIKRIDSREVDVPEQLQGGPVRIGIAEKQGKRVMATWSNDKNIMALAKMFVGPQNAGKTTALKRTAKDCYKAGYSNIVIDFIESCETAREVAEAIPGKDKVMIKLGTKELVPALAYNEVSKLISEDLEPWERIRLANLLAEQVEYLINAVTDSSTGELTAPMLRYLHSACMVIFIKPGSKIADVFDVLRRWDKRNEAIRYAKYSKCFDDDDIFFDLNELHKRDNKDKIIGTRDDLIIGILNRITILQKNPYLKEMLRADIDIEQDFTKYIEEGKSIFIMIPQYLFPNVMVRDILTTFFISRIWLTVQMRENNHDARLCNVIFDEVHQVPTTAKFLSNHVTEFRRHRLGLMLSCHYLKQLKDLLNALKSSGVSYVLIAGTEKENLEMLKEELQPFTIEEGLNLKPHTSLNIVNYGNQYAKFTTALPKY
jgi:hypothetical protein